MIKLGTVLITKHVFLLLIRAQGTGRPVPMLSLTVVTIIEHVYIPNHSRGLINHSLCCAQDLLRLLSDHSLGTALLNYI